MEIYNKELSTGYMKTFKYSKIDVMNGEKVRDIVKDIYSHTPWRDSILWIYRFTMRDGKDAADVLTDFLVSENKSLVFIKLGTMDSVIDREEFASILKDCGFCKIKSEEDVYMFMLGEEACKFFDEFDGSKVVTFD